MTTAAEPPNGRPLKMDADPFVCNAANHHPTRQVQVAFRAIVRQLLLQTPAILVTGPASAGKTLLVDMTARLCSQMDLSVRRVDRGDLLHMALDQHSDVLLVDEANSIEDAILEAVSLETRRNVATTIVFLGLPSCAPRFISRVNPILIQFDLLSRSDAEDYLHRWATNAGFADLFAKDALELISDASSGSPRLLRTIASAAFFNAASECATQIGRSHVGSALAMQLLSNNGSRYAEGNISEETRALNAKVDDRRTAPEKASTRAKRVSRAGETKPKDALDIADPAGSIWRNTDPIPGIWQNAKDLSGYMRIGTPNDISATRSEALNGPSKARVTARRRALAACFAIVAVTAAIATATPWIWTGPASFLFTALPQKPSATVRAAKPAVVSPVAPSDVESSVEPEPIQSAPKNSLQAEKKKDESTVVENSRPREAPEPKVPIPKPLTAEEQAAIARGIREMENAATQASAQLNRR